MKRFITALGMVFLLKSAIAQTKGNWQQEVNYTIKVTLDDQQQLQRGIRFSLNIPLNSGLFLRKSLLSGL